MPGTDPWDEIVPSITGEGGKFHRKGLPTGLGTGTIRFRNGLSQLIDLRVGCKHGQK